MSRVYDSNTGSLLRLPSLDTCFCPETGRSNFLETVLKIVDASGHRRPFESDPLFCLYVKNRLYSPLFVIAESKFVDGTARFRLVDVRMPKYRALLTSEGFPLSVSLQCTGSEFVRHNGLVLEQEYGGSYTGRVDHIDLIGLSEAMAHLGRWEAVLRDAGYAEAAAVPANVVYTSNRYVFEQEFKGMF
jgi:hypothetical protein